MKEPLADFERSACGGLGLVAAVWLPYSWHMAPVSLRILSTLLVALLGFAGCRSSYPPELPREFRAAWIATVDNIDWPTARGLTPDSQRVELIALLDRAVDLNLNAVILQVRPAADAFYYSELEPWSEYLTGEMGRAPDPFYDPLEFAVEEAHARGLELHAWFNPFRAFHPSATGPISSDHISKTRPELVKKYGEQLWLDPGEAGAVAHSLSVIMDVVRRYDIDGIHFDDYFYPYPIEVEDGIDLDFPDSLSWARAAGSGTWFSKSDWRRSNVDTFVEQVFSSVKTEKAWVKVGVAPFGIWRPGHPPSVRGFDAYEKLYADSRKWLLEGWVDYWTPQLYWPLGSEGQPFADLLDWWVDQNPRGRHVWPGLFTSRTFAEGSRHWESREILDQVQTTRSRHGATGNVHFSMKSLTPEYGDMGARLVETLYAQPALVPPSPWLGSDRPDAPVLNYWTVGDDSVVVAFELCGNLAAQRAIVQTLSDSGSETKIVPAGSTENCGTVEIPLSTRTRKVAVSLVSRAGIQSKVSMVEIGK